jgi:hypothetical protein
LLRVLLRLLHCLLLGLADVLLLLGLLELLELLLSPLNDVGALEDLSLPELLDGVELFVLSVFEVGWHLVEEQSAVCLITVGHILLAVLVLKVLKLEVGDR